jgi:hypothetical protein
MVEKSDDVAYLKNGKIGYIPSTYFNLDIYPSKLEN